MYTFFWDETETDMKVFVFLNKDPKGSNRLSDVRGSTSKVIVTNEELNCHETHWL